MLVNGGTPVEITALSRADVLHIKTHYTEETADDAEVFLVARGVGVSEDEAKAWLASTPLAEAGKVVDAIVELSGLGTSDPNSSTSGPS